MKKVIKIITIILIVLCASSFLFATPIFTNDELWNFQQVYKMHNGFSIYKDANVIVTPLFFYLGYIVLSVFSFTILGFRIYNLIIYSMLFIMLYKIFKALKVSNKLIPVYLSLIFLFQVQNIIAGANYTVLSIVISLIGMYFYITKKSNNIKQGIIIFLCLFTKQNVGIFYVLSVLIYELILNKKINLKYIKDQLKKIIVLLIPTLVFVLYLHFSGTIIDFINYCFGSLIEFGETNLIFTAPPYMILILLFSILIYIITIALKNRIKDKVAIDFFNNMTILFIFLLGAIPNIYPILNSSHFIYVFPFAFLIILYFLDTFILKDLFTEARFSFLIVFVILLIVIVRNYSVLYLNIDNYHHYEDSSSPYNHLYIDNDLYNRYKELVKFIVDNEQNGDNVIILSYEAALPMIELKKSNGKYDMFLSGNLGYNGIQNSIDEIKNQKNTLYLILANEEDLFFQDPLEVRNYIINNLHYYGTYSNYVVYYTD